MCTHIASRMMRRGGTWHFLFGSSLGSRKEISQYIMGMYVCLVVLIIIKTIGYMNCIVAC